VQSRAQLAPRSPELPHALLLLLSAGDLAGILLSILLVDRIGRRGCFHLGFFAQATLYVAMALVPRRAAPLAALGFAATGCRCFGWEAAQMWVVRRPPSLPPRQCCGNGSFARGSGGARRLQGGML